LGKLTFEISMSLDGFVAGPNPSTENPLGEGGEQLHEWGIGLAVWRERHGLEGGETNTDSQLLQESIERVGATIMGRRMFGGGDGPWGSEPWEGWWGDDPPFGHEVFVVTHHEREPLLKSDTTFNFVEGIEPALEAARAAAGSKDVAIGGGAETIQQYLRAGLVDEFMIHLVPILLGSGARLLDGLDGSHLQVESTTVIGSPEVTHLSYRIGSER
jgi:dihydrofolate reductase